MAGLEKYMILINIMRMLAHVRFVYVRMTLLSVSKDEETSTIKIRWNIVGLGMVRLVLRYFPDRLWEKGNMERSVLPCSVFHLQSLSYLILGWLRLTWTVTPRST